MTYGYRLNVEQLLFKNATESWNKAQDLLVPVGHSNPETAADIELISPGFNDEKAVSFCIEAVLGWAIATEAFINLAWQCDPSTSQIDERVHKGTISKVKQLCKSNGLNYGSFAWRDDLVSLFKLRDYLVHYKDPITYIGFSFAPKFQRDFSRDEMQKYQFSVTNLMTVIGEKLGMDTAFLSGDYNLFFYEE